MRTKEEIAEYQRQYRNRPETIAKLKETRSVPEFREKQARIMKAYRKTKKHREWIAGYTKSEARSKTYRKCFNKKYSTDDQFKLKCQVRTATRQVINRNRKAGRFLSDLGCSSKKLIDHIGSQFSPGMHWKNWGQNGWHIDHIIPLASFDLTDREQYLKAVNYKNVRPLWAKDNLDRRYFGVQDAI